MVGHPLVGKGQEYGGWYSEPAPLAKVQEEDVGPPYSGDSAIIYAGTGQQ